MKFEKITLWTCTALDDPREGVGLTAEGYILPALHKAEELHKTEDKHLDFKLLGYDSEEYVLGHIPTWEDVESTVASRGRMSPGSSMWIG